MSILKNLWEWLKEKRFDVCIFLVFCLTFSMRVYAINHKTTVFLDDPVSFIVSTPNNLTPDGNFFKDYWIRLNIDNGKNYKIYDIKKSLFESKTDIKSIYKDLKTLHERSLDTQHLNLYYSLLRIWTPGMDFADKKAMIVRGCSLNLIFFMFSFFFMYKLLSLIKNDKKFIALGLFFAFVTTGSISSFLLIRPYTLMEAFFTFVVYVFARMYFSINKNIDFSIKKIILYALGFSVFLLSGYCSLFLLAFISVVLTARCIIYKDIKLLKTYLIIVSLAFVMTLLFCPMYFSNFKVMVFVDGAKSSLTIWNFVDFCKHGSYLVKRLAEFVYYNFGFYIILYTLAFMGISIFGNNKLEKDEFKKFAVIFLTALLWTYLIVVISPYYGLGSTRYIMPSFPILSILLTVITYNLRNIYIISLVIITFISSFIPLKTGETMHNGDLKNFGVITFYNDYKILNVYNTMYNEQKELRPVVFVNRHKIWSNYVFYMPNDTIFRSEEELPTKKYFLEDYVLIDDLKQTIDVIDKKNESRGYLKLKD